MSPVRYLHYITPKSVNKPLGSPISPRSISESLFEIRGIATDPMPSSFIRAKPLQALKLTAVIGSLALGVASFAGVLPGQNLTGLLSLAFFPMILAVVVSAEALLAGYRLVRADDPAARLTAQRGYTAIRVIELVVTVAAAPGYSTPSSFGSAARFPVRALSDCCCSSGSASVCWPTARYYCGRSSSITITGSVLPCREPNAGGDLAE